MGQEVSNVDVPAVATGWYQTSLRLPCVLPDVGIDPSLLTYSGLDSNAQINAASDDALGKVPDYAINLGGVLGPISSIPNAVGLGAFVISLIIDIILAGKTTEQSEDNYSMFHRVFGEEKASSVRDTMSEYVARHRIYMHDESSLLQELNRLESQISNHLTVLKNSLLLDGQMSSRGLKIWVNGAAFHIQMVIHQARLKKPTDQDYLDAVRTINVLIDLYLQDLNRLLNKYKEYKISSAAITPYEVYVGEGYACCMVQQGCYIKNKENNRCYIVHMGKRDPCGRADVVEAYVNHVFSHWKPVSTLRDYFVDVKNNVMSLLNQQDAFVLPNA